MNTVLCDYDVFAIFFNHRFNLNLPMKVATKKMAMFIVSKIQTILISCHAQDSTDYYQHQILLQPHQ